VRVVGSAVDGIGTVVDAAIVVDVSAADGWMRFASGLLRVAIEARLRMLTRVWT